MVLFRPQRFVQGPFRGGTSAKLELKAAISGCWVYGWLQERDHALGQPRDRSVDYLWACLSRMEASFP
jgi:hypothetical protein